MSKYLDLGLGITIINVYYSISYFLLWCVELQHATEGDNEPFVWLAVYTFNLLLNIFLFIGLRKRDRLAVIIWFSLTLLWFGPKVYFGHQRGCRLDGRGSTYQLLNLLMEIYVLISFLVLALVFIYLPRKLNKTLKRQRTDDINNADPQDIQMVDLKQKVDTNVEQCLPNSSTTSCVDQQVSSFDFHRADD